MSPALSIKEMTDEHLVLFSVTMCLTKTVQPQQHVKWWAFNGISRIPLGRINAGLFGIKFPSS